MGETTNPLENQITPGEEKKQKVLESLTPEQEAQIPVFRDKWLNQFYNNEGINKEQAIEGIEWLYTFCEKEKPFVMFMDSPIGCQMLIDKLKNVKDEDEIVDPSTIDVSTYVSGSIKDFEQNSYYINVSDYGWVAFYDYFQSLEFFDYDWTNFNHFKKLLQSGIYEIHAFEKGCIVCSIPKVKQDEQNRLHCEDGYAVVFKDGYSMCYWHGVHVPDRWIFNRETISKEEIMEEKNAERRRVMKEILGSKIFSERIGISCIDEDVDASGNPVRLFKSIEKDELIDDYLFFANVICPSTKREYFISVPNTNIKGEPMNNCWDAVAWTFKMNKTEYQPTLET